MLDLIIIGAGPAGITASIYAERKKMDFLVVTQDIGGQTNWTLNIENYTGYQLITGPDLVKRFREHLNEFPHKIRENETVSEVTREGDVIRVVTDRGVYESKTLVIAAGRVIRKLGVPGEDRLRNKGVAYCATCDAPLFAGAEVAVVGGGNSGLDATLQLMRIASRVHVIDIEPQFRADAVLVEKARANDRVVFHPGTRVTEILGDRFVSGVNLEENGKKRYLPVEGVFIEVGWVASSGFVRGVERNRRGEIVVNCNSETNVPGIFAAGDVSSVPSKQIIVASGEGAKACLAAFEFLNRKPETVPQVQGVS